jgi:hypothetical protein
MTSRPFTADAWDNQAFQRRPWLRLAGLGPAEISRARAAAGGLLASLGSAELLPMCHSYFISK